MKKIMPLAASIALILIAGIFASAGTIAQFSDTETIGVHDIQAGTLDLTVDDANPCKVHITIDKVKPGDTVFSLCYELKNIGNLPGKLSVEISSIVNKENGWTEPEIAAGDRGINVGELGANLIVKAMTIRADPSKSVHDYGVTTVSPYPLHKSLNDVGGKTYEHAEGTPYNIIEPTEIHYFRWTLELPIEVGNEVQSDSVEFDIIFHLVQA